MDRVRSVTGPEMRHGRKSVSKKVDGYKVHVATGGDDGESITAVEVTTANKGEGEVLGSMMDTTEGNGMKVRSVTGDTAYGSGDTCAQVVERESGIPGGPGPE